MRRSRVLLALISIFFAVSSAPAQGIKPGLWKITATMKLPGMTNEFSSTYTQCLTGDNPFPLPQEGMISSGEEGSECTVETDRDGSRVNWVMRCRDGEGESTIKGSIVYNDGTFEGLMVVEQGDLQIVHRMSGERIGDCSN